jgi:predicted dehydrogenase
VFGIGVIGAGLWGPNVIRSFEETGDAEIRWICDPDEERRAAMRAGRPHAQLTAHLEDVLGDSRVDAVAIATPAATHFEVARRALAAGKHVFVEKPFTTRAPDAMALVDLAERLRRVVFVGHVFEYNAAILAAKALMRSGELGEIRYIRCERTNFGPVRSDVNVLWDLAAHEISILHLLMDRQPRSVAATGDCYLTPGIEDVASARFWFADGPTAYIHVSWLHPVKVRQITVVGTRRSLLWDDLDHAAPLRLFDHRGGGEVSLPVVRRDPPLKAELAHFLACLKSRGQAYPDGRSGLRVVQVLEAASMSLRLGGTEVACVASSAPGLTVGLPVG